MSTLDLYSPDFPHGLPAGFKNGCRGDGACPNHGTHLHTCREAHIRYQGDNVYRKMIGAGYTPQQVFDADQAVLREKITPRPATVTAPVVPEPAKRKGRTRELVHGTYAGYQRGCTTTACPGSADGLTCADAKREYQRVSARRRKLSTPTPTPTATAPPSAEALAEVTVSAESVQVPTIDLEESVRVAHVESTRLQLLLDEEKAAHWRTIEKLARAEAELVDLGVKWQQLAADGEALQDQGELLEATAALTQVTVHLHFGG